MEQIKQWIISLLIICVVSSIIMYFSASSSLSRGVRVVASLCISLVFVLPFAEKNLLLNMNDNNELYSQEDEMIDELSDKMIEYAVLEGRELCEDVIIKAGCEAKCIECSANINEDNCIYISKIVIHMSKDYQEKKQEINEKLNEYFKIDGEFVWE